MTKKKSKKKYIKPEVKAQKIFETAALACGKCVAGNPIALGTCRNKPLAS